VSGAVIPAVSFATTFAQEAAGQHKGFDYARTNNPTRAALETCLASLEGAAHGLAFASGMAAEDALLHCLSPGDHIIIPDDAYGGTFRLINGVWGTFGISHTPVRMTDLDSVEAAWQPNTRLVWTETPSNPMLLVVDIEPLAALTHQLTFATPYLQQPLALGADVVVHSMTKYLGGHSDVVGGFLATDDAELAGRLAFYQNSVGAVPGPMDCYLVQRGIKTLAVRMERHCSNAAAVAAMLSAHPEVGRVLYPGLEAHPGHEIASRQMRLFGGMVSFIHKGGEAAALEVARSTEIFTLAESLGAVESLIEHPHRMTHTSVVGSALEVDPGLIRLSVGIESIADLLGDLEQALGRVG
jgi:cystathionine gamma-synthase